MLEFVISHQLNLILILSGMCGTIAVFAMITTTLSRPRRLAITLLELSAMILLNADRFALLYDGDPSRTGYVMVRLMNFLVFSMTLVVILAFNLYLIDLLRYDAGVVSLPPRLHLATILAIVGIVLIVISQFTGLYYTFDASNTYHRSYGFILCYLFPVLIPLMQASVIIQYRKRLNRGIYISLLLFIFVPMICSFVQGFFYGIALTDISFILMAAVLFIFALFDINATVEEANEITIAHLNQERKTAKRLLKQTATAFVAAVEEREAYMSGHGKRVAAYAKELAERAGKDATFCDDVYFAGMLHDIGKLNLPEELLSKNGTRTEEEQEFMRSHTTFGAAILYDVKDFPFLREAALYHHERWDGTGYPEGLCREAIPEIARIVAIADAYDTMASKKRNRGCLPQAIIRENFVKEAGYKFDPFYAELMVEQIDADYEYKKRGDEEVYNWKRDLICGEYRSAVSKGILIQNEKTEIRYNVKLSELAEGAFAAPSILLFDSYDGFVHEDAETIKAFGYMEYGELWFDGHYICTSARNVDVKVLEEFPLTQENERSKEMEYRIVAGRYEDHVKIQMRGPKKVLDITVALPNSSKYAYIGLTGEHCTISDIYFDANKEKVEQQDIARIANHLLYTNRMESDLPNFQTDGARAVSTVGIPIRDGVKLAFHSMSLPTANLVWHCPYLVLFSSDNGLVDGRNFHEYALLKLNGENEGQFYHAKNQLIVRKDSTFVSWDDWNEKNRQGMEYEILIRRKGNRIIMTTENGGILLQNTTTLQDSLKNVYVSITGDQCAITDIRIGHL